MCPIAIALPTAVQDVCLKDVYYSPVNQLVRRANYRMHKMRQCDGEEEER